MKGRYFYVLTMVFMIPASGYARIPDYLITKESKEFSYSILKDTVGIGGAVHEEDTRLNKRMKDRLEPIRANFKKINSIGKWTSVKKIPIEGESAEGGEAVFYYQNNRLEKITARHYGETGQVLTEYYLLQGNLSFVFEKDYTYNRQLFYNAKMMRENKDTEAFDFDKSKITETRSYFEKGNLIFVISSHNPGTSFSNGYLAEKERRITGDFKKLLALMPN